MSDDWENEAREEQQLYFSLGGGRLWDVIQPEDSIALMRKVGYGLFGPPHQLPSDENEHTGYAGEKLQHIEEVTQKLRQPPNSKKEGIRFSCIQIIVRIEKQNHTLSIFKSQALDAPPESWIFVDSCARVYANWQDWLDHEKLPACRYCVPTDGVYTVNSENQVALSFLDSKACSLSSQAVSVLDGTSTVLGVGATAIGIAAMFVPLAGPILYATAFTAGTAGAYGASRSLYELLDRNRHRQSVSFADREARGYWLSLVSTSFSIGTKCIQRSLHSFTSGPATTMKLMDLAEWRALAAAKLSCRSVDGIKILHACERLHHDFGEDKVDPLLIFQLAASVLFFTNSLVSFQIGSDLIKPVQGNSFESKASVHDVDQSFEILTQ